MQTNTLRSKIMDVLKRHGESFINVDQDELDSTVMDTCTSELIQAIFHDRDIQDRNNPAVAGYRVRDLIGLLAVYYDTNAPIKFTSAGIGGSWPMQKQAMQIYTEHQVGIHKFGDTNLDYLGISLIQKELDA